MEIVKKIPDGYKNTDIGVIPKEWDSQNIVENSTLKARIGWQGLTTKEYLKSGDYVLITGTDFSNGRIDWKNCWFVEKERYQQDINIQIKDGDILITKDGTIGKIAYVEGMKKRTTLNSGIFVIRPKSKEYITKFLYYIFNSFFFEEFLRKLKAGSTISHLYQKDFVSFNFAIPPLPEQKVIAKVLSDIDELILSIERLYEKKQNIKTRAMEDLLAGEKRLPGFSEEWKKEKIKHIARISTGSKNTQDKKKDGKYPFIVRSSIVERINSYSYDCEAVLTAGDGVGTGKIFHYMNGKFEAHQRVYIINEFSKKIHCKYFYLMFSQNFYRRFTSMTAKSSVDSIRLEMIADMQISLPPLKEQISIAQILTDMDNEIEQLEVKSNKYKKIKQGMMQELLTGRIRLIDPMITKDNKAVKLKDSNLENILKVAENQPIYKGRNENFNEAVIMAVITDRFATKQYPLGSFRRQKLIYLFHRQIQESTEGFLKKAMGSYDHKLRYSIEKIAKNSGYIKEIPKSRAFVSGDKISEAKKYFNTWYCREMLEWLDQFKYKKSDELEVLTTVDMAMVELVKKGKIVNVKSIKEIIRNNKEWKPKLEKDIFNDVAIGKAMNLSNKLFD